MQLTASLIKSTIVAALGGLLFGFDTAVIAGTTAGLTHSFQLTPSTLGVTVSVALVGTVNKPTVIYSDRPAGPPQYSDRGGSDNRIPGSGLVRFGPIRP